MQYAQITTHDTASTLIKVTGERFQKKITVFIILNVKLLMKNAWYLFEINA